MAVRPADRLLGGVGTGVDYAAYDDANWGNLVISLANPSQNTGVAAGDTVAGTVAGGGVIGAAPGVAGGWATRNSE